jgi:hypothetical protein
VVWRIVMERSPKVAVARTLCGLSVGQQRKEGDNREDYLLEAGEDPVISSIHKPNWLAASRLLDRL